MNDVRARAEQFVGSPVHLGDLALVFDETTATTVDVHVGGSNFFPPILADIAAATSSVHINQYGFRPGTIGDAFANALLAKAAEGVAVRVVVDRVGSRPGRGGFYERLRAGGVEVRVMRNPGRIDHRKVFVVDGRVGWVGGAGIEDHFADGRFHDLFVRLTGPVVAQLQLVFVASFRWLGAPCRRSSSTPSSPSSSRARSRRRCSTTRPAPTVPSRPPSRGCSTARATRST